MAVQDTENIVDAVLEAHRIRRCPHRRRAETDAVGNRLERVDGLPKVTGDDKFGADYALLDALWLRVLRSPHARAIFEINDLDAFLADNTDIENYFNGDGRARREQFRHLSGLEGSASLCGRLGALSRRSRFGGCRDQRSRISTSPLCRSIGRPRTRSAGFRARYRKAQHPFTRIRLITS